MKKRTTTASLTLAISLLTTAAISPAAAVSNGTPDTGNTYANVGSVEILLPDGIWVAMGCAGTLIAPDVALTLAACIAVVPPDVSMRVNFNPQVMFPSDPADPLAYMVAARLAHPGFSPDGFFGLAGKPYLDSPFDDNIGLLWLAEPVVGITPAPFAGLGYLDSLDLRDETFIAVGYGVLDWVLGSAASPVGQRIAPEYRSFRDVRALGHDAYPDRYLQISVANCGADAGAPLFHDGTVVAIAVWYYGARCEGPGLDFRVDSAVAQDFLNANL